MSHRKIAQEEVLEQRRLRDLRRKRHEEFEKVFKEAVGYQNTRQATNIKIIREREKKRNDGNMVDAHYRDTNGEVEKDRYKRLREFVFQKERDTQE